MGTSPSQQGFRPRHSTTSALLSISARVVSGFNQRKPRSRTINSHSGGHLEGVRHGLTPHPHRDDPPLLTPTQFGEMACGIPSWQEGLVPLPTAPLASPTLFNHFLSDCPISDLDRTSYADDFTLLASAPSLVKARANQFCSFLVKWADGKQLAIAPQKSIVTLFTSDTHQSRNQPSSANRRRGGPVEQHS